MGTVSARTDECYVDEFCTKMVISGVLITYEGSAEAVMKITNEISR